MEKIIRNWFRFKLDCHIAYDSPIVADYMARLLYYFRSVYAILNSNKVHLLNHLAICFISELNYHAI